MVDEKQSAIETINDSIKTMHQMSGVYPKDFIEKAVERVFIDNNCNYYETFNVFTLISNKKYQRTAENHLKRINKTGTIHNKDPRIVEKPQSFISNFLASYFLSLFMVWPAFMGFVGLFGLMSKDKDENEDNSSELGALAAFITLWVIIFVAI